MSEAIADSSWDAPGRHLPALRLLQGIGLALDGRKLLLALLGLLLMGGGWALLDRAFPATAAVTPAVGPRAAGVPLAPRWDALARAASVAADPVRLPAAPARAVFALGGGAERFGHGLLGLLWAALVWTFFGGAIARLAVVEAATGGRRGFLSGLRFAASKAGALLIAPLVPLAGVAALVGVAALFGLLYRPDGSAFAAVAGALGFVPLLLGLVLLWLLIGLAAGWPLMVASVAAEVEDSFDALSRAFSYVFQRPVLLAILAAVAWVVGTVGVIVVQLLVRLLLHLTAWALAFGAPDGRVAERFGTLAAGPDAAAPGRLGGWSQLVALLAYSFAFAYFWSAAAQIYLLVRHDVDGTPLEDVAAWPDRADAQGDVTVAFAPEPPPAQSGPA